MPDPLLDEAALAAFRRRSDDVVSDGLRVLAGGLAQAAELSQLAVDTRAESEHQKAVLQERRRAESSSSD
ncbi:hypothetical protein [Flindersiella endophytica]